MDEVRMLKAKIEELTDLLKEADVELDRRRRHQAEHEGEVKSLWDVINAERERVQNAKARLVAAEKEQGQIESMVESLENQLMLKNAAVDALGSQMLDLQKDCVELRRQLKEALGGKVEA